MFHTDSIPEIFFNSFLASGYFCRLLITFANSLVPDQKRQNVSHDLDLNPLTLTVLMKKVNFEKVSRRQLNHEKLPSMQKTRVKLDKFRHQVNSDTHLQTV